MAIAKKKVKKHTLTNKNSYLPHKIRSHPFYFIWLPLRIIIFFVFFWIVLVPVLYIILMDRVPGFAAFTLYFFVGMFVLFLIALAIFVCQWRCKNSRQSNIYYIECEPYEPQEMVEFRRKPLVFEVEKEKMQIVKETPKKVENERENLHNVVHKEKTVIFREETKVIQRPVTLILEKEPARPCSQNLDTPLSPRELFFLDMYDSANKAMRNATNDFIQKERLFYDPSGPVQRESSDDLSGSFEDQQEQQHPTDQAVLEQSPARVPYLLHESSPVSELSPLHSRLSDIIQDQGEIVEQTIVPVIRKVKAKRPKEQYPTDQAVVEQSPSRVPYSLHESSPVSKLAPLHTRPSDIIYDQDEIVEHTIVPVVKKGKAKRPKEMEYFVGNIVPTENWKTEAYLFVQEEEKERKPYTVVVGLNECD